MPTWPGFLCQCHCLSHFDEVARRRAVCWLRSPRPALLRHRPKTPMPADRQPPAPALHTFATTRGASLSSLPRFSPVSSARRAAHSQLTPAALSPPATFLHRRADIAFASTLRGISSELLVCRLAARSTSSRRRCFPATARARRPAADRTGAGLAGRALAALVVRRRPQGAEALLGCAARFYCVCAARRWHRLGRLASRAARRMDGTFGQGAGVRS